MQIVFADGESHRELDVRLNDPAATVADLRRALDPRGEHHGALLVDGRTIDPAAELWDVGLCAGAIVRFEGSPPADEDPGTAEPPRWDLVVVNGLDAGRTFTVRPGRAVIGRVSGCDLVLRDRSISRQHAALDTTSSGGVTVTDLGSHNGTSVDGAPAVEPAPLQLGSVLRLGALQLELRAHAKTDRALNVHLPGHVTPTGTVPFNRPPRPAPEPRPERLRPPEPLRAGPGKAPWWQRLGRQPGKDVKDVVDRGERERFRRELDDFRRALGGLADEERFRLERTHPDPAEVLRRVMLPSTRLWERRPQHHDFLHLRVGLGGVAWELPVTARPRTTETSAELTAAIDERALLTDAPVTIDLAAGGVVGIVGEREGALAVARSLVCQTATLHGPVDVPMMFLASAASGVAWDWAKWLPHVKDAGGGRLLADDAGVAAQLAESGLRTAGSRPGVRPVSTPPAGPTYLVVVDDVSLTEGRTSPTRRLLRREGGAVAGIVLAPSIELLPPECNAVIEVGASGRGHLRVLRTDTQVSDFAVAGMADDVARHCARSLARFEDPELDFAGSSLPSSIRLLPLLGLEECSADAIRARWKAAGPVPRPATPIGVAESGVLSIDLVDDGPHGLVGGTAGSGKSELLRTLVAGLAASVDPDHLNFVLIDVEGRSAFGGCAHLPHTVGLVTDLDEHLADRALRSLGAELARRERTLRAAGATDLGDYLRHQANAEPMPRLLVIVDELAALRAELPQFVDSLVGIAQRGRSLGVHLLLATQRPQAAVTDNIKANSNLRIALRVIDEADSVDLIGGPDAAFIDRGVPGRAYVRLGPDEVVAVQASLVTRPIDEASRAHVDIAPFVYGPAPSRLEPADLSPPSRHPTTDLSLLVDAIGAAFAAEGLVPPRRPWLPPLPRDVDLAALGALGHAEAVGPAEAGALQPVVFALADDPDAQSQHPDGWRPAEGNLVFYGTRGSGTTTALSSLALALAGSRSADDVHLYLLDFGAQGGLRPLRGLPHVGALIEASERERQARLIRYLRTELDRRRALGRGAATTEPMIVLMIDGWSAFAAEHDDLASMALMDDQSRIFADGPDVGIFTIVAADRPSAVPARLAALVKQRWALRLADIYDYSAFGIRSSAVPEMSPGRAVIAGSGQTAQIARPTTEVTDAVAALAKATSARRRPPARIETLATHVRLSDLDVSAQLGERPWALPVGIDDQGFQPISLVVHLGEHVLVTGPARSGKSSVLLTIAAACRAARPDLTVVAVAGPRSPLAGDARIDEALPSASIGERLLPLVDGDTGPVLLLVDDAEAIEDERGLLQALATSDRPDLLLVAAGRNDGIRSSYSHWTRALRRSKVGVLLRPDGDLDGDLLDVRLPRRTIVAMVPGRGYVVNDGEAVLAQMALPE